MRALVVCGLTVFLMACSNAEPQACTPPRAYWQKPHNFVGLLPLRNDISLDQRGNIYWNGDRVSAAEFTRLLKLAHEMNPEPDFFLQTEMGVPCKTLEAVRDRMDAALECRKPYSACAEGIASVWRKLPTPPGRPIS